MAPKRLLGRGVGTAKKPFRRFYAEWRVTEMNHNNVLSCVYALDPPYIHEAKTYLMVRVISKKGTTWFAKPGGKNNSRGYAHLLTEDGNHLLDPVVELEKHSHQAILHAMGYSLRLGSCPKELKPTSYRLTQEEWRKLMRLEWEASRNRNSY